MSVYGLTTLEGARRAAKCSQHHIAHTNWLYDAWGKSFLNTMLNVAPQGRSLSVVGDQRGAPPTCRTLAQPESRRRRGLAGPYPYHLPRRDHLARLRKGDLRGQGHGRGPQFLHYRRLPKPRHPASPACSVRDGRRHTLFTALMPASREALQDVVDHPEFYRLHSLTPSYAFHRVCHENTLYMESFGGICTAAPQSWMRRMA